jgi:hypothetical protein
MITNQSELSSREYEEMKHRKEMYEIQSQHELAVKRLELEVAKVEAGYGAILKIPLVIITLPVRFLFGIAYIVAIIRKAEPDTRIWSVFR